MGTLKRYQMTIDGKKADPASGEWFESANPYTGKAWAEIPRGNAEDIDRAVQAAKGPHPYGARPHRPNAGI